MTDLDPGLIAALERVATVDRLLLASDYDGCVAPIVARPEDAVPHPDSIAALQAATGAAGVDVALVSGRAVADLRRLSGADDPIVLVGSHGSEFESGFAEPVTAEQQALLGRIVDEFRAIAADHPGATVEVKPVSATLHVRNIADADDATAALERARRGPARLPGVQTTEGKAVIELAVIETSKGSALDLLRERFGSDAVIYLGDDVTDEKAFARLRDGDVGIKVGDGATAAQYRIPDPAAVAEVLRLVGRLRGV